MDELLLRALLGGALLALMAGPLGALMVWRRMAYTGDAIAHASLLGVALSLITGGVVPQLFGMLFVALVMAMILARYAGDARFTTDSMLGVLSHGALALGLVLVSLNHSVQVDINAYLFGDILSISWAEIGLLALLAGIVLLVLKLQWRALLIATLDTSLAKMEGIHIARQQLLLTLLLGGMIAIAVKITGILLIIALLIIPAASARYLARSPGQMACVASLLGMLSVLGGLSAALKLDVPAGPMMVVAATVLFIGCALMVRRT